MFKKDFLFILTLAASTLLSSCALQTEKNKLAQQALQDFFDQLAQGEYEAAVDYYGGSYETMVTFNPDLDPEDYSTLWQHGCQMNGLQCLTVRTADFNQVNSTGEYIFTVEFNNPDGSIFVLTACCGEDPTTPPQSQFDYRVVEIEDGQFRVLDLPVYMP